MTPTLVDVRLLGVSLAAYRHSSEHHDELFREFALITERQRDKPGASDAVPARLLALITDLRARFSGFSAANTAILQEAAERGDEYIDLVYRIPPEAGGAAMEFDRMLDDADAFCRAGDLLTMATPPEAAAFRRWFLGQFAAQAAGAEPTPWPGRYGDAGAG